MIDQLYTGAGRAFSDKGGLFIHTGACDLGCVSRHKR